MKQVLIRMNDEDYEVLEKYVDEIQRLCEKSAHFPYRPSKNQVLFMCLMNGLVIESGRGVFDDV